jgi:NAD(P)-dependent dehydrogenase (short-subunit alcohol dehydrogenase family)
MSGAGEAFRPEQLTRILETNAVSWLRLDRAVLPVMRRQRAGTLVYVSSATAHLTEPCTAPYIASKAAGAALADVMGLEVSRFGIDTVILVPGAFTRGTEHFADANGPSDTDVAAAYAGSAALAAAVPDLRIVVHDLVDGRDPAGDGLLAVRAEMRGTHAGEWFGVPATGREFRVALHEFHRTSGGFLTTTWHLEDWFGWFQQVGAWPAPREEEL